MGMVEPSKREPWQGGYTAEDAAGWLGGTAPDRAGMEHVGWALYFRRAGGPSLFVRNESASHCPKPMKARPIYVSKR